MPHQQEMNVEEFFMLKRMANDSCDGFYNAVVTAYNAGFEAGTRYKRTKDAENVI